jgi:hypothetical protein
LKERKTISSRRVKKFLDKDDYIKFREAGNNYIAKSLKRTTLIKIKIKIKIEHMTGKRRIKEN